MVFVLVGVLVGPLVIDEVTAAPTGEGVRTLAEATLAVVLFAVHFLLTSVIETLLLGRTLDLSPFAIILSLTFWGLVWGVGGLFLAVPLTGALAIICRHLEGLEWFGELIAGSKPVRSRRRLRFGT